MGFAEAANAIIEEREDGQFGDYGPYELGLKLYDLLVAPAEARQNPDHE